MSKIHIIPSEFNQSLELQLAYSIKAGFPSPANAIKHDFRSKNPTTRWSDIIRLK